MSAIDVAVQTGLAYALLAMGIYITFRILNIPDLTADGSFTLGIAVSTVFTLKGQVAGGLLIAFLAGAVAGLITGFLQTKAGIHPVLAGILTMFGLQSVNLFIMGTPNLSMLNNKTIFEFVQGILPVLSNNIVKYVVLGVFALVSVLLLQWFFSTRLGLSIRATGSNPDMVRASSINVDRVKMIGFAVSNAFVALSGALVAQLQKGGDVNMGIGSITIGMASLIIGEVICGRRGVFVGLISAVVGSVLYRLILQFILDRDIPSYSQKLISAVIIGVALSIPVFKAKYKLGKVKRQAKRNYSKEPQK